MKRISVIIPVYNAEEYIDICLNALIKQIKEDDEIILIDDGSTDNSEEKCKKYFEKQSNIKYFKVENGGPARARNIGIDKASGKYIIFLDSDDFIEDNYIEKMLNYIQNADLAICGYKMVKEFNSKIETRSIPSKLYNKENMIEILCNSDMINILWNKIFKLDIIKNNGIKFDESEFRGEDLLFNLDYIKNITNIYVTEDVLYNYIMKNSGLNMGYNEKLSTKLKRNKKVHNKMMEISKKDRKKITIFTTKNYLKHFNMFIKSRIKRVLKR